jgi:predicted MFS family arabinose efflux permease
VDARAANRSLLQDLRALRECPRELWLVLAATALEYVGVYSFLSTLALWLTSDFGFGDQAAGWWAAEFSLLISLVAFLVGPIADVLGIRRTLVLSFGLSALLRGAMALAPSAFTALLALNAFAFAYASGSPALQTSVHRYSTASTRSFAFTLWYVALNVGGVVSGELVDATRAPFVDPVTRKLVTRTLVLPVLGATSLSAYRAVMGLGAFTAGAAFALVLLLRTRVEKARRDEDGAPAARRNPLRVLAEAIGEKAFWRFMLLLGLLALVKMMFQHMQFTWPKYVTRELGDEFPWGKIWALNSLLILVFAPLAAALTRRLPVFDVLLYGALISAASPFLLCLGSSYTHQVVMVVMFTVGEALWSPRSYEYTVAIAPPGRESTYVSLSSLPWFVAKFFVGPASGYLLAAWCPASGPRHAALLWLVIGITTMLGPVGILALRKVIEGKGRRLGETAGAS